MILGQINTNNLKKLADRTKSFKISVFRSGVNIKKF